MKKLILTTFLVLFLNLAFAQTKSDLIGKWTFKGFPESANLSEAKKKTGAGLFKDFSLDFSANMQYEGKVMGVIETGTWKPDTGIIELTSDKGNIERIDIISFSGTEMTIKYSTAEFVLQHIADPENKTEILDTKKYIIATPAQISKKWYLKSRTNKQGLSEQQLKAMSEALKGSFFEFRPDNSYSIKAGPVAEDGSWSLNSTNTGIISKASGTSKVWHIIKVTDTDLVLVLGTSSEFWTFSSIN